MIEVTNSVTNASLVMGDSGTGKSSLLATLAEWGWKKYKKVSLLYSTDTGGYPSKMDALIRAGIVRVWKLRTRGEAFETCSKACEGFWPVEFTNHVAGETIEGVKLLKPTVVEYSLHCKKCETVVKSSDSRTGFQLTFTCPKCSTRVNLQNGEVSVSSKVHPFFEDVGLRLYDGLTSMNDWIMGDMAEKGAKGFIKGEASIKIVSGEEVYGSSTRNHYGFAQTRSLAWIQAAANLPGHVVGPVFTARKRRATEKESKMIIYGPQIAGEAKTSEVPSWVANCIGLSVFYDEKGRRDFRMYLTTYKEPGDEAVHLCKTRTEPGDLPDYLSDGPVDNQGLPISGVKAFTEFNLGHLMDKIEEVTTNTLKKTLEAYPDAPGLGYVSKLKEYKAAAEDLPPEEQELPEEQLKAEPEAAKPKPAMGVGTPRPTAPAAGPKPRPQLKRPGPRPGVK